MEEKNFFGIIEMRRGDAFDALCRGAQVPALAVIRLNRLERPPVEGQMFVLPRGSFEVHIAAAGDSAETLCARCGMDAEEFRLYNGEEIFLGQELLVRRAQ